MRASAAAAALGVALFALGARAQETPETPPEPPPAEAPADPPRAAAAEQDMMRYPPSGVRSGLILGGGAVLGLSYGLGAMCAALWPEVPGSDWLYAPVIGPWAALALSGCAADDPDCSVILYVRGVLYVLDGLAQLGGLGLIGEGVFMTTEAEGAPPEASYTVVPMAGPHHAGLGVAGTF